MTKICNHLFEVVDGGYPIGNYSRCVYCGITPSVKLISDDKPVEWLSMGLTTFIFPECELDDGPIFDGSSLNNYDDPAHIAFPGHELNHK